MTVAGGRRLLIVDVGSNELLGYWSLKREWAKTAGFDLVIAWNNPIVRPSHYVDFSLSLDDFPGPLSQLADFLRMSPRMRSLTTRLAATSSMHRLKLFRGCVLALNGASPDFLPNEAPSHSELEFASSSRIGIPPVRFWDPRLRQFGDQWHAGSVLATFGSLDLFSIDLNPVTVSTVSALQDLASSPLATESTLITALPNIFEVSHGIVADPVFENFDNGALLFRMSGWEHEKKSFSSMRADHQTCVRAQAIWEQSSHPLKVRFGEPTSETQTVSLSEMDSANSLELPLLGRIDDTIRAAILESQIDEYEAPLPIHVLAGLTSALAEWLNEPAQDHDWLSRYWRHVLRSRHDVVREFPNLESWDRQAFLDWATETLRVENSNPLIARPAKSGLGMRWNPLPRSEVPVDLQVVGYLRRESSLGDVARRLLAEIDPLVPQTGMLAYDRTMSPRLEWMPNRDGEWLKAETGETIDTSIIVVNSDQLGYLLADLPMVRREAKSLIGYWYWELETPPRDSDVFDEILDEIWVGSTFVQKSVESGASIPVRYVPLPVGKPETSELSRQDLGLPNDTFVFTTTFDFYSVGERKNPEGSITAFKEAFPTSSNNVALVIKTMHAKERREEMVKLEALADGRSDIVFVDGVLDREDQHRLLELSDCLVSLHRSEGFGLHLAEAMHLGTPVIATRYSANLDFMDDDSSLLVDYTMIHPSSAQPVYSTESLWADPDIKHAAQQMRRLFEDSDLHQCMSRAGKARIEAFDEMARHLVRDHIARITTITMEPTS